MTEQLTRAKEFFIENLGSHDHMEETGCLQEYLQYNISTELEYTWIGEFIAKQFSKADSKCIKTSELISSVSFVVTHYGRYQDYKKLLALKDIYLNGTDILELYIYYDNVLKSVRTLLENNHIASELKLDIMTQLENMVDETIKNIDSIPDQITGYITQKYDLQAPKSMTNYNTKFYQIYQEINIIKSSLQNLT